MEVILALVPPAVEAARTVLQETATGGDITDSGIKFVAAALVMSFGGLGPALAIGNLAGRAMEALGRNPEAQTAIQTNMILGLAFAEAIAIYALVVAIMIGFVF